MKEKKSIYCRNKSKVLISDFMSGKMEDIPAISTSVLMNPRCLSRIQKAIDEGDTECICWSCFAKDGLAYKKGLRENCEQNYKLLNSEVLSIDELPIFKKSVDICRIEAFGDVGSVTHCLNYINICKVNPNVQFTMWTKNIDYWDESINDVGKPDNLICVVSSPIVNKELELTEKYWWVDKIFTVYSLEWINANGINVSDFINCGGRKCDECRRCYGESDDRQVRELLKKDQKKLSKGGN